MELIEALKIASLVLGLGRLVIGMLKDSLSIGSDISKIRGQKSDVPSKVQPSGGTSTASVVTALVNAADVVRELEEQRNTAIEERDTARMELSALKDLYRSAIQQVSE